MVHRVLSYNSFPGSPIPYIRNGTAGIGQNDRLRRQLLELNSLEYDIGCFQEIFSKKAVRQYTTHHSQKEFNAITTPTRKRLSRTLIGIGIRVLLAVVMLLPIWIVTCVFIRASLQSAAFGAGALAVVGATILHYLAHEWAVVAFSSDISDSGLFIFYKKHKYELLDHQTLELPQTGDFMNLIQPRLCLVCTLRCRDTGILLVVANTHLNALGESNWRLSQIETVLEHLSGLHAHTGLLCGDMNAGESSIEVKTIVDSSWEDAGSNCVKGDVHPTWSADNQLAMGWMRTPAERVDFVFTRVYDMRIQCAVKRYQTVMKGLQVGSNTIPSSDHYGVLVDVDMRASNVSEISDEVGCCELQESLASLVCNN